MDNQNTKIMLLVCDTRTGSTAFGNALAASNPGVAFVGEIFSPNALKQNHSFFGWLRDRNVSALEFSINKRKHANAYLQTVSTMNFQSIILDTKYHDAINFLPVPALVDFSPTIYTALADFDGTIIHLIRRDKFACAISSLVAQSRNVFHLRVGERLPQMDQKIFIQKESLLYQIRIRILSEVITMKQIANSRCRAITVYYEEIFGPNASIALTALEGAFGFKLSLDQVLHQKLGNNYSDLIENYAELAAAAELWNEPTWPLSSI